MTDQILPVIGTKEEQKRIIIYVDFVKDAAPLAISLRQVGYSTCSYHGQKMSSHDKMESIESWRSGTVKVMVCTTAFGIGINQADVEIVIRIGCPPNLESMVQEFGRAGRDGRPAKGNNLHILYYNTCHVEYLHMYILHTCTNSSGILFYQESDLQHASFWLKTNPSILQSFSESWK